LNIFSEVLRRIIVFLKEIRHGVIKRQIQKKQRASKGKGLQELMIISGRMIPLAIFPNWKK
jgi:hypothetical protein